MYSENNVDLDYIYTAQEYFSILVSRTQLFTKKWHKIQEGQNLKPKNEHSTLYRM
jgi:hypothetical protein